MTDYDSHRQIGRRGVLKTPATVVAAAIDPMRLRRAVDQTAFPRTLT